jgi:hypothetical protein
MLAVEAAGSVPRSRWIANAGKVFAVLAVTMACAGTAAAQATPKLVLTNEEGLPYMGVNTSVVIAFPPEFDCGLRYGGETLHNNAFRIIDYFREFLAGSCARISGEGPPDTISGSVSQVVWRWDGVVRVIGNFVLGEPGPCVYKFSNPVGHLAAPVPGERLPIGMEAPATGALLAKQSNIFCTPVQTLIFSVGAFVSGPLEWELRG